MIDKTGVRILGLGWCQFASSIVYPTMLLAVMISGCSSPHDLRWPRFPKDPTRAPTRRVGRTRPTPPDPPPGGQRLPGVRSRRRSPPAHRRQGTEALCGLRPNPPRAHRSRNPPTAVPPADREYPIDLTTALRLAEVENPLIAEARQRIGEALAVQQGARALLFPTLNVGTNYHSHTGNLQRSSGRILNLNEKSLYLGGGAEAVAAGTVEVPAVNIFSQLTDAIFEPLAARQQVEGARFNASATANNILLEVAELHFELLAAEADLRVRRQSADQAAEVARLTQAYARAQQGREADAERAATELSLIEVEVRQAEEEVAVGVGTAGPQAPPRPVRSGPARRTCGRNGDARRPRIALAGADPGGLAPPPGSRGTGRRTRGCGDPPPGRTIPPASANDLGRVQRRGVRRRQQPPGP